MSGLKKLSARVFVSVAIMALAATVALAQTKDSKSKAAGSSAPAKATTAPAKKTSSKHVEKLDINAATRDQLKELPGIGDATADKIIAGRPYRAKNDLVKRKIISESTYEGIKEQIIAHQPKAAAAGGDAKGGGSDKKTAPKK
ncbi:MAG TPA: helix-hairpin-helix domain-containing protein [Terriglobales bacterium]|jgi:DNA uptake protein ComE-like DNA-binding protein|nr:helix-hairpin-helix domain-containing protein [Terriglobales bacterium]